MKRLILSAIVLASSTLFAGDGWQTDYKAALEQAAKENKPVLIDFTGSDWCGWCIKMQKDTFSQQAFKDFAAKNLRSKSRTPSCRKNTAWKASRPWCC